MEFSIADFNPSNPKLIINGMELEFKVLSLKIDCLLTEEFGSPQDVHPIIKREPLRLFDVAWIFLVRKDLFDNSPEKFKDFCMKRIVENSKNLVNTINACYAKSAPIIRNRKSYDAMMKIHAENNEQKPICYAVYYDRISKRYGYSIEQFYDLSLRQLHALLTVSTDGTYEEIEIQAALQGRKLKARTQFKDVDEVQDKKMDDEAAAMFARAKKEYEETQGKK